MLQTKAMSYAEVKPKRFTRYMQILEIIGDRKMTAREIENGMNEKGYSKHFDMNHVRPRLIELTYEYHELIEDGTVEDYFTHKQVAIYRKTTQEEKLMLDNENHYTAD